MAEDYDRLSKLGEEQSRKLGEFWIRHQIVFDACFCGPARRHAGTVEIAGDSVRSAGLPWPEPELVKELDEFDAFRMMQLLTPRLAECDPEVRRLNESFNANRNAPEAGQILQKLFEAVARSWCSGLHDVPDIESWAQFCERVRTGIDRIRSVSGRGRNVAVFTSGGVIAATVARALELTPEKGIEFVWLSRNASFSEFLYSDHRFSVHSFNSIPHIEERRLLTYR
jgi:broad specificity phosphatase PhoE